MIVSSLSEKNDRLVVRERVGVSIRGAKTAVIENANFVSRFGSP